MNHNLIHENGKVLLIVEDFDSVRNLIGKFFQTNGYTVISVGSIEDALMVGQTEWPSVVVIDYEMQKNDPYLAISVLHDALPSSYVVMMNGLREHCNDEKAKVAGAHRILDRVFQAPVLKDVMRAAKVVEYSVKV